MWKDRLSHSDRWSGKSGWSRQGRHGRLVHQIGAPAVDATAWLSLPARLRLDRRGNDRSRGEKTPSASKSRLMPLAPKAPLCDENGRPYFLWSEDIDEDTFRRLIAGEEGSASQALYMGRLLREARVAEVWYYLKPQDVADHWTAICPHLGRMRQFWRSLLEAWSESGKISWQP